MKKLRELPLSELSDIADACFLEAFFNGKTNDEYNDNVQRHLILGMQRERGAAFVGKINLTPETRGLPIVYPWTGERVASFSVDFVVPILDEQLAEMIARRTDEPADKRDPNCRELAAIIVRIQSLGGYMLHWSCAEAD